MTESVMILVIDLEATCDEGEAMPPGDMEIIEIGAVWASPNGSVHECFQTFVQPVLNPRLTAFCTGLTGIRQGDVATALRFPEAAAALAEFAGLHPGGQRWWGSWGRYDFTQFGRDCARHGVDDPLAGLEHINLKRSFANARGIKEVGLAKALQLVDLALEGRHHRGLDDARNIARLLPWCLPAAI